MPKKITDLIPKKALLLDDLLEVRDASSVPKSGHVVKKVFIRKQTGIFNTYGDKKGASKMGFYKPCCDGYPPLLAQLSVAISALYRTTLGERAAEERLVYNDTGEIVGTVSLAIDGFVPMQTRFEASKSDPKVRRLAAPTTRELINRDAASALVVSWRRKERDLHPNNIGTGNTHDNKQKICRIDWDNSHANITDPIRGKRAVQGLLTELSHNACKLRPEELDNFPHIESREHWPTHLPQHGYLPKAYESQSAFVKLKEKAEFQDQKHFALLKELLAYQPDIMRLRLHDLIGDSPLNLEQLPEENRKSLLADNLRSLFYEGTRERDVVEHVILSEKEYYEEFYRVTVKQYPNFNQYLIKHPEAFEKAKEWFEEQNSLINPLPPKHKQTRKDKLNYLTPFKIKSLENRYLKIWQDAALQNIYFCLKELQSATNMIQGHYDAKSKPRRWQAPPEDSLALIDHAPQLIDNLLDDDEELEKLKQFITKFAAFYQFSRQNADTLEKDDNPTPQKNKVLIKAWSEALEEAKTLFSALTNVDKFQSIFQERFKHCEDAINRLDYETHVQAREDKLKEASIDYHIQIGVEEEEVIPSRSQPKLMTVPCPTTATRLLDALIEWLDKSEPDTLRLICRTAKTEYESRWASWSGLSSFFGGGRSDELSTVLQKSKRSSNFELLSTLFKTGGWDTTSYNTTLLKKLLSNMKDKTSYEFKDRHPILSVIKSSDFDKHISYLQLPMMKRFKEITNAPPRELSVA